MQIAIQISETVSGIRADVAFSVSPEALMLLVADSPGALGTTHISSELEEVLIQAVLSEARRQCDEMRQKLLLSLVAALTSFLRKELEETKATIAP